MRATRSILSGKGLNLRRWIRNGHGLADTPRLPGALAKRALQIGEHAELAVSAFPAFPIADARLDCDKATWLPRDKSQLGSSTTFPRI